MKNPAIITYPRRFDFVGAVSRIFGIEDLSQIHRLAPTASIHDRASDQKTELHRIFYANNQEVLEIYEDLMRNWIPVVMGSDDLIYQAVPTFRVHLPGSLAVGEFHKDSEYAHSREEINFWLPVTEAFGTNSIWVESREDAGDYRPTWVKKGEVFRFPGGILRHGNKLNDTGVSRVSFDFRAVRRDLFSPTGERSASAGIEMKIGSYYKELHPHEQNVGDSEGSSLHLAGA